ncbi:MAG TPA: transcriptional regulator [Planctomycetaceae bacterium]|nr:transcriptional regulator [Planctomycetaceae bacterium]
MAKQRNPEPPCPVTLCRKAIGGKWKPVIIYCLHHGIDRFGELRRHIDGISKQMLTKQLRELEEDELVLREVFAEVPPRVEYTLSERGKSVLPVIRAMKKWGECQQVKAE